MTHIEVFDILRGADVIGSDIHSEVEVVELVARGLPVAAADVLRSLGGLSAPELGEIIPQRTLSRARQRGRLSPEQSDRIVRAIRLFARAHDVFANREKANRWMRRPNRSLEGRSPLPLLRTSAGAELVESILDRIVHGVYS